MEQVGRENIFIFGLTAEDIQMKRASGYNPEEIYASNPELRQTLDMISWGYFSPSQPDLFTPVTDSLLRFGDSFMLLADFDSYAGCQERVSETYRKTEEWTRMSILNVAHMGIFSSDRAIKEYAEEIWGVKPVPVELVDTDTVE
jgi:starch phosphorylase